MKRAFLLRLFPWGLYGWFIVTQIVMIVSIVVIITWGNFQPQHLGIAVAFIVLALLSAKTFIFPMKQILIKLRDSALLPKNTPSFLTQKLLGEWVELESTIDSLSNQAQQRLDLLLTERVEQATIAAAISDALVAIDLEGTPLFFNSRFAMYFGWSDANTPKAIWETFREPELLEAFKKVLADGRTYRLQSIAFPLKMGTIFFSISITPLSKPDGKLYGAVGLFHDITELKQAEQMRIDFVANVSHELRTPLTSIKGFVDTLLDDLKQGRPIEKDFLEIVGRGSRRLMDLINDLLDLSALESTDLMEKRVLSTQELSDRVLSQQQGILNSRNQKVEIHTGVSQFYADPKRAEQVLVNLLDNASKYSAEGSLIRIRWLPDTPSDGSNTPAGVLLKVEDQGPGISPEHLPRLFERFYRVDKSRSRNQGGTGLGLAIVKHILVRHGGAVWVKSELGKGSTFVCQFPAT